MATLQDLIKLQMTRDAGKYRAAPPVPHSFQSAPAPSPVPAPSAPAPSEHDAMFADAFARLDALSARCDALLERNKRWTRYITG